MSMWMELSKNLGLGLVKQRTGVGERGRLMLMLGSGGQGLKLGYMQFDFLEGKKIKKTRGAESASFVVCPGCLGVWDLLRMA